MAKATKGGKDSYDIALLKAKLSEFGFTLNYFPEIDSTMRVIEEKAKKGEKGLSIALTDHQTSGVGRASRRWQDTSGCSLMFSALFQIPQASVAAFADLAALTICEVIIRKTGRSIQIKYPNDIVFNDKKLGGILVKNIYDEKLNYLGTNLGIGINIHYKQESLSNFSTDYPATSLDEAADTFVKRQGLLIEIIRALRTLNTELKVILVNLKETEIYEKKWREVSSVLGRKLLILKNDKIVDQGLVMSTGIGKGVELATVEGQKWVSLFATDMKARIQN